MMPILPLVRKNILFGVLGQFVGSEIHFQLLAATTALLCPEESCSGIQFSLKKFTREADNLQNEAGQALATLT